jgi:hypothetical protein
MTSGNSGATSATHQRPAKSPSSTRTKHADEPEPANQDSPISQSPSDSTSHCFAKTLDAQIDTITRKIEEWLVHAEPLDEQGRDETARDVDAHQPDIRDCFPAIAAA